ncbi:helicase [Fibrobacteres bacterium R8-0-B4]
MLLDNTKDGTTDKTVAGWLSTHAEAGDMDIVTGYFTIGALSWLNEHINRKIDQFRIIWGGIAGDPAKFDLLNQEIGIGNVLRLRKLAENAIKFLEQEKVDVKSIESDYCHAKLFLLNAADDSRKFFVTGNSNLTEAGLGTGPANHIELNTAVIGGGGEHNEFAAWFDALWNNTRKLKEAKQDFLDEIANVFKEYTPCDIYMKIVSELLPEENWQEKIEQRLGRTDIYKTLFDFQKKAVVSLVKMLEKKNGAVLADAVGLGKTFTALAVIKYYRMQNREVVLLAPKRLKRYWEQYTWHDGTAPDGENFDFEIILYPELTAGKLSERLEYLTNEKPKLFVLDESHDLQNDEDSRYQFLLEIILRNNSDAKVLMLSASPLNNSLWGIRNRIKLISGFENIDAIFRRAQERLNEWAEVEHPTVGALVSALRGIDGGSLLNLTDSLILARTRKMVTNAEISFPKLERPANIFEPPNCVENTKTITEIIDLLPVRFSAYMPAAYAGLAGKRVVPEDCRDSLRLVKMMHILLAKRLESSWVSFKNTLEKILAYHKSVLQALERTDEFESGNIIELLQDEDSPEFEELAIDKPKKIPMKDIKDINKYERDIIEDIANISDLLGELEKFSLAKDIKIKRLIEAVEGHIQNAGGSKKALIFTAYGDTAEYLFSCLRVYFGNRANVECVTGDTKNIDDILKRFSPKSQKASEDQLERPIDILIATDVLGEDRNLQDCDCVINYDIHWNPIRVVQRVGCVDRIGGQNKVVYCVNFWPSENIGEYLELPERIEKRAAAMTAAESEISGDAADNNVKTDRAGALEQEQIKRSLRMMQSGIEDIEPETFGLSHLSLEGFRQDLTGGSAEKYKHLPGGVFSGFKAEQPGLIALLQHKKSNDQKIAFINEQGAEVLSGRQEILLFLHENKDKPRYVPASIENGDGAEIDNLSRALSTWLESKVGAEIDAALEGLFAGGQAALDMSAKQKEYLMETLAPDNWNLICWEVVVGVE